MSKQAHKFEFGTFEERLEHVCKVFEIEPPEYKYDEDGDTLMTDNVHEWHKTNGVCVDWLYSGSPSNLLKHDAKRRTNEREYMEIRGRLAPEVVAGMTALLRAVVLHKLPTEPALDVFRGVIEERREAAKG